MTTVIEGTRVAGGLAEPYWLWRVRVRRRPRGIAVALKPTPEAT